LDRFYFRNIGFIEGAFPVRYWLKVSASTIFAAMMVLAVADRQAGSQPFESSEAWCKAHNFNSSAAASCIEAEKRLLSTPRHAIPRQPTPAAAPLARPQPAPKDSAKSVQRAPQPRPHPQAEPGSLEGGVQSAAKKSTQSVPASYEE